MPTDNFAPSAPSTPSTPAAPAAPDSAPSPNLGIQATGEPAPAATTFDWNGELAALDSADWFSAIPEDVRPTIRQGIEKKVKHLEGAFTTRTQALAQERQQWDERREQQMAHLRAMDRLMGGDLDALLELQTKVAQGDLRIAEAVKQAEVKAQAAFEERLTAAQAEWKQTVAGSQSEADVEARIQSILSERNDYERRVSELEAQIVDRDYAVVESRIREVAPDAADALIDQPDLLGSAMDLARRINPTLTGQPLLDDAIRRASRMVVDTPATPQPQTLPKSMQAMTAGQTHGDLNYAPPSPKGRTAAEVMNDLYAQASATDARESRTWR